METLGRERTGELSDFREWVLNQSNFSTNCSYIICAFYIDLSYNFLINKKNWDYILGYILG